MTSGVPAVIDGHGPASARPYVSNPVHAMQCSDGPVRVADHAHDVPDVPHRPALALGHVHPVGGPVNPDPRPAVALGYVHPVHSHYQSALAPKHAPRANPMSAAVTSRARSRHAGPLNRAASTLLVHLNGEDKLVRGVGASSEHMFAISRLSPPDRIPVNRGGGEVG